MFPIIAMRNAQIGSFLVNDVMYCWNFKTGYSIMYPCVAGTPLLMTIMFEV